MTRIARANRQGRYPKLTDLYSRILRAVLDSEHEPLRFNQLWRALKPGSLTTFSEAIKKLVADKLLEFDYETKCFKVTERGRDSLAGGPAYRFPRDYMRFLVEGELFKDRDEALKSAVEFALGYLDRYVLSGLLTTRSSESEKRVRTEILNLFNEDLHEFQKTYSKNLKRLSLHDFEPWNFDAVSPFMLIFAPGKQLGQTEPKIQTDEKGNVSKRYPGFAEVSIPDVQRYLRKRYRSFKPESLTYDRIRSFVAEPKV